MEKSGCKEIDLTSNKDVESKLYLKAIELYTVAIALHGDNAIYYCNKAAAYTHSSQDAKAIIDYQKVIAIDPKYIKAYCRLEYIYFTQGKYTESLEKGYGIGENKPQKVTHLDSTNQSARANVRLSTKYGNNERNVARTNREVNNFSFNFLQSKSSAGKASTAAIAPKVLVAFSP
nr:small glutamine-rich tetratricopeptide repeat-containing protein [Tanacetum cinerariifolium]